MVSELAQYIVIHRNSSNSDTVYFMFTQDSMGNKRWMPKDSISMSKLFNTCNVVKTFISSSDDGKKRKVEKKYDLFETLERSHWRIVAHRLECDPTRPLIYLDAFGPDDDRDAVVFNIFIRHSYVNSYVFRSILSFYNILLVMSSKRLRKL